MNTSGFDINGEFVSTKEAGELIRSLYKVAEQIAGEMHGKNRSKKFRKNWPNEYLYAASEWKTYVVDARRYALWRINDHDRSEKTPEHEKQQWFKALYLERLASVGQEVDNRLQLMRGTQQFEGDKFENRRIVEDFGDQSNTFAELALGTTALANGALTRH